MNPDVSCVSSWGEQRSSPPRLVSCGVRVECSAVAVILRVTRRVGEWKVVLPPFATRVTTATLGYRQDARVIAIVSRCQTGP